MKEKILEALKTKFTGVQDSILSRVAEKLSKTTTTDEQVTTTIEGVTMQTLLDSYADSRVGEATNTAISNYEKKHGIKDGKAIQQQQKTGLEVDTTIPPDAPEWAKAIIKQNQEFANRLSQVDKAGQRQALQSKLTETLKGKVPASYLKGRTIEIEDETQLEALANSIVADYTELKQEQINSGVVVEVPKGGGNNGDPTAESIDADIKRLATKF